MSTESQVSMFGCTVEDMHATVANCYNVTSLVVSMISDAQEQIAHNDKESARRTLNFAKFVADSYLIPKGGRR